MATFAFHGDLVWAESPGRLRQVPDGYLLIQDNLILGVSEERPSCPVEEHQGSLVIPALYDLHLHAPQYAYCGLWMDEELLGWLEKHTFPIESRYKDPGFSDRAYGSLVDDITRSGTARFSMFGTIYADSTLALMAALERAGLSGYVGKVNMDRNSPDYYREETWESLAETERFLDAASSFGHVMPIITPRFTPSCSESLLEGLGRLAKERKVPVQSHLDENLSEIDWVRELCPWSRHYAETYERYGLFGDTPAIMAHCIYLDDEELGLMREKGVYVAHAPSSNANVSSGIAPVRKFLEMGISTGLSSDVAGGSSLSMFRAVTDAVQASKLRWRCVDSSLSALSFSDAFFLATKGGGSFFGNAGSFEKGYEADVLVIDDWKGGSVLHPELTPEERLEYYTYRHPDEFIAAKLVGGRRII